MEFKVTKKNEALENNFPNEYYNDSKFKIKFHYYEEIIEFRVRELMAKGYTDVRDAFIDIINVNKVHFHSWLEIDDYASQVEFNLEKVYLNLTLLDYDAKLWFKGQSPEEIALWKTFRVLDTRPEIGDGKMAVFNIQEGISPPNEPSIYYIDRASCWKTNLTFIQYYEAVLDMMGIADWQLLFTDVSWNDPKVEDYYQGLKESLEALAKAFPDKDYSRYFELLEARWV
ncbi:hypothetical protein [uncultured Flavobacterium sp.]|uniref:hypothetical protein n=1 Tax=uncultured Flavobacterium sp. TaxID=165435 RepID=UPI0025E9C1A5|nr:hypothetical protein [uncultured Flavobacterium sp.]